MQNKPIQGHGLMQTIARLNRVFQDNPCGLVMDYLGLANNLLQPWLFIARAAGRAGRSSIRTKPWPR